MGGGGWVTCGMGVWGWQVWLGLNVSVEMDGEVRFNYSVDIPLEDSQRGFFFYIDDTLTDSVLVTNRPPPGGTWMKGAPLTPSHHPIIPPLRLVIWGRVRSRARPL